MSYIATVRKGGKKYGVARWEGGPDSCLASAQDVFRFYKVECENVEWESACTMQRMWAGMRPWALSIGKLSREQIEDCTAHRFLTNRGSVPVSVTLATFEGSGFGARLEKMARELGLIA